MMKTLSTFFRRGALCGLVLGFLCLSFFTRAADDTVKVEGSFSGQASKSYTLEWYFAKNKSCSDDNTGAPLMVGKIPVTTNASGSASYSFDFKFPRGSKKGKIIMSATDDTGAKTNFKACHDVIED